MVRSSKKTSKKSVPQVAIVVKNGHTDAELAESGERWSAHTGPYLSVTDILVIEADKQK